MFIFISTVTELQNCFFSRSANILHVPVNWDVSVHSIEESKSCSVFFSDLSYDFDAKYQDDRFINMQIHDILAIISFCLIILKRHVYVFHHLARIYMMVC